MLTTYHSLSPTQNKVCLEFERHKSYTQWKDYSPVKGTKRKKYIIVSHACNNSHSCVTGLRVLTFHTQNNVNTSRQATPLFWLLKFLKKVVWKEINTGNWQVSKFNSSEIHVHFLMHWKLANTENREYSTSSETLSYNSTCSSPTVWTWCLPT